MGRVWIRDESNDHGRCYDCVTATRLFHPQPHLCSHGGCCPRGLTRREGRGSHTWHVSCTAGPGGGEGRPPPPRQTRWELRRGPGGSLSCYGPALPLPRAPLSCCRRDPSPALLPWQQTAHWGAMPWASRALEEDGAPRSPRPQQSQRGVGTPPSLAAPPPRSGSQASRPENAGQTRAGRMALPAAATEGRRAAVRKELGSPPVTRPVWHPREAAGSSRGSEMAPWEQERWVIETTEGKRQVSRVPLERGVSTL